MTMRWLPVLFTLTVLTGCGSHGAAGNRPVLENTHWIVVADSPVGSGPGQRDPDLILRRQDHSAAGFTGCTRSVGLYTSMARP